MCLILHFYGEVSERRPWVFKREDRPQGVPNFSAPWSARDATNPSQTAKLDGEQRENLGGKDRDPLQSDVAERDSVAPAPLTIYLVQKDVGQRW